MSQEKTALCFVFRTSIQSREEVNRISDKMDNIPGMHGWSVDLDDWEKVLRIECSSITSDEIVKILWAEGIYASSLL